MADFSTNVSGSSGAAPQPIQPVVDHSGVDTINALGNIGTKLLSVGAAVLQKNQAQEQQKAVNGVVSGFAQKQLNIASAVDTGELSSQEARMRMRANYTQAITDNPGFVDLLAKTQKEIVSTAGLGSVVVEGTEQEQMQRELTKTAVNAGWVKANASPDEASQGVEAYRQFKRHQEDINAMQNQLSLDSAQIGLQRAKIGLQTDKVQQVTAGYAQQSARMGLDEKIQKQRSQVAVGGIADSYYWKLNNQLEDIKQRKASNQLTAQEAVQAADQAYSMVQQTINSVGRSAGSDYVSNVAAPLKGLYDNSKQFLTGEIDEKVLNTRNAVTLGTVKQNLLGDPDVARVTAVSQLFGPSTLALQGEVTNSVVRILDRNSNPDTKPHDVLPDTPQAKQENGTYLSMIKANIKGLDDHVGQDKPKTVEEINSNLTNILKSIDVHSLSVNNPSEYNQVTDFLASPEYGSYTSKGGSINRPAADNARTILQSEYVDKVSPLVQKAYQDALTPQRNSSVYKPATGAVDDINPSSATKSTALIKPYFSGGGVVFRAEPGANQAARSQANDLNAKVSPVVNKLIRMDAHLGGDTDYKTSYDRNFKTIFGFDQKDLDAKPEGGGKAE